MNIQEMNTSKERYVAPEVQLIELSRMGNLLNTMSLTADPNDWVDEGEEENWGSGDYGQYTP